MMMKLISFALFVVAFQNVSAFIRGMNFGANNPDGSCKSTLDWHKAFSQLKQFTANFTSARTFSAHDCNTIMNVAQAAKQNKITVLVGIWTTTNDDHFKLEKDALRATIEKQGHDWIDGFIVGNEDLYRKDLDPKILVSRINDVRSLVRSLGVAKPVGHSDTFSGWTVPTNADVIKASDFIGHQGYPYWQGTPITDGNKVFWEGYRKTKSAVNQHKPGTPMWITESGWPVTGSVRGAAVPSVPNAARYYKDVACSAYKNHNVWWYAYQEPYPNPSFGLVDLKNKILYDTRC